jgi:hypothetical protein
VTKLILMAGGLLLATGCLTRAPTTYELDRRAGFATPPNATAAKDEVDKLRTSSAVPRAPHAPVKVPPLIEKVWVSDQVLADGAVLQGTWLYLEIVGGRWLNEVDPGGAPLIDLDWRKRAAPSQDPGPASTPAPAAKAPSAEAPHS